MGRKTRTVADGLLSTEFKLFRVISGLKKKQLNQHTHQKANTICLLAAYYSSEIQHLHLLK